MLSQIRVILMPISVAARSKASICGRSLAGIAGLSPSGGIDIFIVLCCTVKKKGKMQDSQDAETSTDNVQRENKRIKKNPAGVWMFVL